MPGHDTLPERKLFPQHILPIHNSRPFQGWNSFCFVLNFSYPHLYVTFIYSLFVSGGAVSSEFNILCISGVNEFWQLCQINLRFSDISASTMSKHLFCESSILKCCMYTFGWNVPIGNSKDASEKVGWRSCLNTMNPRTRKLESLEVIFFEKWAKTASLLRKDMENCVIFQILHSKEKVKVKVFGAIFIFFQTKST